MFATTFFAIFVVPISRNPIVKPFLVLENGQIRDQLINSGAIIYGMGVIACEVICFKIKKFYISLRYKIYL